MAIRIPDPPPSLIDQNAVVKWMREMQRILESAVNSMATTKQTRGEVLYLRPFTVATVPSAAPAGKMIFVTDDAGGATPAYSDGSDWRRTSDGNVIST